MLGLSEMLPVAVRCTWLATANNPVMTNEMARRTVRCRLDSGEEFPHLRSAFKHRDLERWTMAHRGELVGAILTLVQAWIAAGRPAFGGRRLGSFEDWTETLGGILEVIGVPGFLANLEDFYATADTEGTVWRDFVRDWWAEYGPEAKIAADLVPIAIRAGIELTGNTDQKQSASLGTQVSKQADNVYDGLVLRKGARERGKGQTYKLVARDGRAWEPPAQPLVRTGLVPDGPFTGPAETVFEVP